MSAASLPFLRQDNLDQDADAELSNVNFWNICQLCACSLTECICCIDIISGASVDYGLGFPCQVSNNINTMPLSPSWGLSPHSDVRATKPLVGFWDRGFLTSPFENDDSLWLNELDTLSGAPQAGIKSTSMDIIETQRGSPAESGSNGIWRKSSNHCKVCYVSWLSHPNFSYVT